MLSFLDIFHVLSVAAFCSIPIVFFMKRIEAGEKSEGGHRRNAER